MKQVSKRRSAGCGNDRDRLRRPVSRYCIVKPGGRSCGRGQFPEPCELDRNTFQWRATPHCSGSGRPVAWISRELKAAGHEYRGNARQLKVDHR